MTPEQSKEWFKMMSKVGADGKIFAALSSPFTTNHWETMYQAFKARMESEKK